MSTLANQLTVLRVAIIPLLVLFFYWPALWAGYAVVALFVVAAITDWFDGYIARRLNQTSGFGAFLDPVADKLIVTTSLALITEEAGHWLVTVAASIIIGREITVSGLREWMAQQGQPEILQVAHIAKVKTAAQMVAISFLLLGQKTPLMAVDFFMFGLLLLYLAVFLTVVSMLTYIVAIIKKGKGGDCRKRV